MRVLDELLSLGNPDDASFLQRFFRTGPGEYGEGDAFLGIRVPVLRHLARAHRILSRDDVSALLDSPWHEARLLALLVLGGQYARGTAREQAAIYRLYMDRRDRVNNWDLVDSSAPQIVGAHLLARSRKPLYTLARSARLWDRRIAIVATQAFIRADDFDDTEKLAVLLLDDREDLIHKATGWMLREMGTRDEDRLHRFLDAHAHELPRTTLRYAIERLTPAHKRLYMGMKARRAERRDSPA